MRNRLGGPQNQDRLPAKRAPAADVSAASSALPGLIGCAEACEGPLVARLVLCTSSACDSFLTDVRIVQDAIPISKARAQTSVRTRYNRSKKRLEMQEEQHDSVIKALESLVRQFDAASCDSDEWHAVEDSLAVADLVLDCLDTLPLSSCALSAGEDVSTSLTALSSASHLMLGIDTTVSKAYHRPYLITGKANSVTIRCLDASRAPVLCFGASDVRIALDGACVGWGASLASVELGVLIISVEIATEGSSESTTLQVSILGTTLSDIPLEAGVPIKGQLVRSTALSTGVPGSFMSSSHGLAISADGGLAALANIDKSFVSFHSFPSGEYTNQVGGYGTGPDKLRRPQKLCFAPSTENLLVCDSGNARVRELLPDGSFVRDIATGEGVLTLSGIAADLYTIAVGVNGGARLHSVLLLDYASGERIRAFGEFGTNIGKLNGVNAIRYTPDGGHILIGESLHARLSFFTLSGLFVRCVPEVLLALHFSVEDVDFASNGDIVVCGPCAQWHEQDCVTVLSPDGTRLVQRFGRNKSRAPTALLTQPVALAMYGKQLVVLDSKEHTVFVFD